MSKGLDSDRKDILSVLIWVQTVYKVEQQTTKVAASMQRIKIDTQGWAVETTPGFNQWF